MAEPVVTRVSDVPFIDGQGNLVSRKRVEFRVGDHGPFSFVLATDDFTEARIREEMRKIADTLRPFEPR